MDDKTKWLNTVRRMAKKGWPEKELLRHVDRFNEAAEAYFRENRHALENKPFSDLNDALDVLFDFSVVAKGLRLGPGMTVLDFGAGTCWASALLNRMGCRTVSLDISKTAIEEGKRAFRLDSRQRWDLGPRFLTYDGRRFPLEDASVDRILCLSAFHHVPNWKEILKEMHRVLISGGRIGFLEPGPGHTESHSSQYEMERYGVLERPIDLQKLWKEGKKTGFTKLVKAKGVPQDRPKFFLHKGEEIPDSRTPSVLRGKLSVPAEFRRIRVVSGRPVLFPVKVKNTGDTLWLARPDPAGGFVQLGVHLHEGGKNGRRLKEDVTPRIRLPKTVFPGETVELEVRGQAPGKTGKYTLRLDLVDEQVTWFSQTGSPTLDIPLVVE